MNQRDKHLADCIRKGFAHNDVYTKNGRWSITNGHVWESTSAAGLALVDLLGVEAAVRLLWSVSLEKDKPKGKTEEASQLLGLTVSEYVTLEEHSEVLSPAQIADLLESGWFPFEPDPIEYVAGLRYDDWSF